MMTINNHEQFSNSGNLATYSSGLYSNEMCLAKIYSSCMFILYLCSEVRGKPAPLQSGECECGD